MHGAILDLFEEDHVFAQWFVEIIVNNFIVNYYNDGVYVFQFKYWELKAFWNEWKSKHPLIGLLKVPIFLIYD